MKFNVPYYAQTTEFSCGPACVLMVMKHFDQGLKLGRELEFEVWRECNMIGAKGADPYGLAIPLIDAGYEVHLVTKSKRTVNGRPWRSRLRRVFSREEMELSLFGMRENRQRAMEKHLKVAYRRPRVSDIVREIREGWVPIALVHMGVVHSLNIPHWVVVTDGNEEGIVFNDPYPPKGRKGLTLSHLKFQKMLDDIWTKIGMSPSVLYVRNKRRNMQEKPNQTGRPH
jgi:hypothetical protein